LLFLFFFLLLFLLLFLLRVRFLFLVFFLLLFFWLDSRRAHRFEFFTDSFPTRKKNSWSNQKRAKKSLNRRTRRPDTNKKMNGLTQLDKYIFFYFSPHRLHENQTKKKSHNKRGNGIDVNYDSGCETATLAAGVS
jgi:hypothetical protein